MRLRLTGTKELRAAIRELDVVLTASQLSEARQGMQAIAAKIAAETADDVRAAARRTGSDRVAKTVFSHGRGTSRIKNPNALVGVRKLQARGGKPGTPMAGKNRTRDWITPPRHFRNPKKIVALKVAAGGRVAMSRASAIETGTRQERARPFFNPTIKAARARMRAQWRNYLRDTLRGFARSVAK